jgi:quercetin dioxygenase-like cupin family protein
MATLSRPAISCAAVLALYMTGTPEAHAEDPVEVDPRHYSVEFENDAVRILRVRYAPSEKSVMHEHPASVGVYLTDAHIRITLPDGRSGEPHVQAGQAMWHAAGAHLPENIGDTPLEIVLVELKEPPAPGK